MIRDVKHESLGEPLKEAIDGSASYFFRDDNDHPPTLLEREDGVDSIEEETNDSKKGAFEH